MGKGIVPKVSVIEIMLVVLGLKEC